MNHGLVASLAVSLGLAAMVPAQAAVTGGNGTVNPQTGGVTGATQACQNDAVTCVEYSGVDPTGDKSTTPEELLATVGTGAYITISIGQLTSSQYYEFDLGQNSDVDVTASFIDDSSILTGFYLQLYAVTGGDIASSPQSAQFNSMGISDSSYFQYNASIDIQTLDAGDYVVGILAPVDPPDGGQITFDDYGLPDPPPLPAPEPASLMVLGTALVGFGAYTMARRRSRGGNNIIA